MKNLGFRFSIFFVVSFLMILSLPHNSFAFSGVGGGLFLGTGFPTSIDAIDDLTEYLNVDDTTANLSAGAMAYYQTDRYRLGASFQYHVWGGWNTTDEEADTDSVGLGAYTGGFYGTYSVTRDKIMINFGGVVGAGAVVLGYDLGDDRGEVSKNSSISTFYLEPQVSVGLATCPWFGIEFLLSAPIFIFDKDLTLSLGQQDFTVESNEMNGIKFSMRLIFGKIAEIK